jgi:hypothetical protein
MEDIFSRALSEPVSDFWRAKRDLASATRQLSEAVVTTNATVQEIDMMTKKILAHASELNAADRLYGQRQFEERGDGTKPDLTLELNALGGWSNPITPGINVRLEEDRAYGNVRCGWAYEGPPESVHGGIIAAILDYFLGKAQLLAGGYGVTAGLNVRYRKLVPLNTDLQLEAWCEKQEGRKIFMKGVIKNNGEVVAEGEGIFIRIPGGIGLNSLDVAG